MLRDYGVSKFHSFLRRSGAVDVPRPSYHYGLSLILGGAESTLGDLTNAYSNMGRSIQGLEATRYSFLADEKPQKMGNIFDSGASWQVFDALKGVNRPEEIDWRYVNRRLVAWKRGTSYGFRDAWAIGATPDYAVGVWVGNASGEGRPNLVGARTAGPVMFDIFAALPASGWFSRPAGKYVEADICVESGRLKGRFCENYESRLILPKGRETDACPYHILVNVTPDERFRVYESSLRDETAVSKSWFVLPPAWAVYYRQYHPSYRSLPPFKPGCSGDGTGQMQFIYPQSPRTQVNLPKQLDGSDGSITIELAHMRRAVTVFWHVDSEYFTSATSFHKISLSPSKGRCSIVAVDEAGNSLATSIVVSE